jgi:ferrochelatase
MPRYLPEPVYRHGSPPLTAVLLINLGTPAAPTAKAAYAAIFGEFLADPRVVEIPRPLWWLILNGIILQIRPRRSAEKYASVWTTEGSPLKVHVERQAKLLRGFPWSGRTSRTWLTTPCVTVSRRLPATLSRLKAEGCTRILLLPLYPQYAASTTATAFDAGRRLAEARIRNQPEIRSVRSFADHPGYIQALAASVREHWMTHGHPRVRIVC